MADDLFEARRLEARSQAVELRLFFTSIRGALFLLLFFSRLFLRRGKVSVV